MKTTQTKISILGKTVKMGIVGSVICLLTVLILSAVGALCLERGLLMDQSDGVIGSVVRIVSLIAGTASAGALVREGKLKAGAVAFGISVVILLATTVLLWDGAFDNVWLHLLGCAVAGSAGVLLNMLPRKKKRKTVKHCR